MIFYALMRWLIQRMMSMDMKARFWQLIGFRQLSTREVVFQSFRFQDTFHKDQTEENVCNYHFSLNYTPEVNE